MYARTGYVRLSSKIMGVHTMLEVVQRLGEVEVTL